MTASARWDGRIVVAEAFQALAVALHRKPVCCWATVGYQVSGGAFSSHSGSSRLELADVTEAPAKTLLDEKNG